MSVIGAMLLSDRATREALRSLRPEMFYRPAHRLMFKAAADVAGSGCESPDFLILSQRLKDMGNLADVGGEEYLLTVADYVPSAANAAYYVQIVMDKWARRELEERLGKLRSDIHDSEKDLSSGEMLSRAAELTKGLGVGNSASCTTADPRKPKPGILTTGIEAIDRHGPKGRGLPRGEVTTFCAKTGGGKSVVLCQLCLGAARRGLRVAYVTLEMTREAIEDRMIQNISGWKEEPSIESYKPEYFEATEEVRRLAIPFWDASTAEERTVEAVLAWIENLHDQAPLDLVCIDYAQKLGVRDTRRFKSDVEQMQHIAVELSMCAKTTRAAIVTAAQMVKTEGGDWEIKYCRKFAEESALIANIFMPPAEKRNTRIGMTWDCTIDFTKSRHGTLGCEDIRFNWRHLKFEDWGDAPAPKPATVKKPEPQAALPEEPEEYDPFADE